MTPTKQIFLIEDEYVPKESIKNLMDDLSYEFLLEHQYLKLSPNGFIAFQYVGVITFSSNVICILPKYFKGITFSDDEKKAKFKTVLKVLKKVQNSVLLPDSKYLKNSGDIVSEIAVADYLLRDYIDYGIYQKRREEVLLNSSGEVNWDRTISTLDPVISRGKPIYHDLYNYSNITEEFNLIAEIHKWTVKYCLKKYSDILEYNLSFQEDSAEGLNDLGDTDHLLGVIERELRITYIDREINLLENLHKLISKKAKNLNTNFNIYGTGYFHTVWEQVCSYSFNNKKDLYSRNIPKPEWKNTEGIKVLKDTIDPDVVATNKEETLFFVLDAKYYNFRMHELPNTTLSGNPGVGDVSKQILYEKAFKDVDISEKHNAFLFPGLIDSFFEIKGSVTFALLEGHEIFNIVLNPEILFASFLSNEKIGFNQLDRIAAQLRLIQE